MRTNGLMLCSLVVLELMSLLPCDEGFVKISVPTAFALITAAVKIKAIWLKAYMGLRSFGPRGRNPIAHSPHVIESHFQRYKRSTSSEADAYGFRPEDLMSAWNELEKASGRKLVFDETSCAKASRADALQLPLWGRLLQSEFATSLSDKEYASLVSSLIGSLTNDPRACQFTRIITASLMMTPVPVSVDLESTDKGS